jgi:hypothetical protein
MAPAASRSIPLPDELRASVGYSMGEVAGSAGLISALQDKRAEA